MRGIIITETFHKGGFFAVKDALMKLIYFLAEKGKLIGINRSKLKAFLYPAYRFFCCVIYRIGGGYIYLYHVELPLTQRCNLRCKHCSFFMPYFKNPVDFPLEDLIKYIDRLHEAVDSVQIFRILGGEPFLYKDLYAIVKKAIACQKFKTIEIVTNGTIVPSAELLDLMKGQRVKIQISYYGKLSRNAEKIKAVCDEAGVSCVIRDPKDKTWGYAGDLHNRGRTAKELKKQLKRCGNICRNFQNGKLYFCPRASFGSKLGMPDSPNDFVDFTQDVDVKTRKKQIFELNQKRFIAACNYCDEGTEYDIPVPVAEQL